MEGNRELRPELGGAQSCDTFQAEARALLFKEGAAPPERDFVELRLAIAREGAVAFQAEAARAVAVELEKSRLPSAAEIIAGSLEFSSKPCQPGLGKPAISLAMPPQPARAWRRP